MTFRRTRCPHCKGKLEAAQRIHPECIDGYAGAQAAKAQRAEEKKARAAAKVERAETRLRKEAIKSRQDWAREAQAAFNAFIRAPRRGPAVHLLRPTPPRPMACRPLLERRCSARAALHGGQRGAAVRAMQHPSVGQCRAVPPRADRAHWVGHGGVAGRSTPRAQMDCGSASRH